MQHPDNPFLTLTAMDKTLGFSLAVSFHASSTLDQVYACARACELFQLRDIVSYLTGDHLGPYDVSRDFMALKSLAAEAIRIFDGEEPSLQH